MAIKYKLISIIMFTSITALLLTGTIVIIWGQKTVRRSMVENLQTQAEITAENCKAALAFEDVDDATETLKALRAQNSVVLAEIHTKSGEEFAFYSRDGIDKHPPVAHQEDGYNFNDGLLIVLKSIILDGEVLGGVCLQSEALQPRKTGTVSVFTAAP
jgi:hypothetical protein